MVLDVDFERTVYNYGVFKRMEIAETVYKGIRLVHYKNKNPGTDDNYANVREKQGAEQPTFSYEKFPL